VKGEKVGLVQNGSIAAYAAGSREKVKSKSEK